MTSDERSEYGPFFDQDDPEIPVLGMISSADHSAPYELDAIAVFKTDRGFLVVAVSGCSCWPDRGSTTQTVCSSVPEVEQAVRGHWSGEHSWSDLIEACQNSKWELQTEEKP